MSSESLQLGEPDRDASVVAASSLPWYRQVDRTQWKAFLATFLGWVLDGFDFTILTFVLIDIQKTFSVDSALAGALGTVTLLLRLVGGFAAGALADRFGRKLPLMLSILWFSLFACLSGFSTSYAMLFAFRALFGIGMGGEWAAGMPLALEHWPAHLRGIASGLLQGGYSWGLILSALVFHYVYPLFDADPELAWRAMFWVGVLPALLVLWIRSGVAESPVWLERERERRSGRPGSAIEPPSVLRIFRRDLRVTTLHCGALVSVFMCSYYSIIFWYPTHLREVGLDPFSYVVSLNLGGIGGAALCGRLSETRLGRRGAVTLTALIAVALIPFYVMTREPLLLWLGAFTMGLAGSGMWGVIPTYLTERYPVDARGVGAGFTYHVGAAVGSVTPLLIGALRDAGSSLSQAMALCIAGSTLLAAGLIWLGPETRGR